MIQKLIIVMKYVICLKMEYTMFYSIVQFPNANIWVLAFPYRTWPCSSHWFCIRFVLQVMHTKHCDVCCVLMTRFILQNSIGFSWAGIARINDFIRTYIYCILGAQVQARTTIIGHSRTSPDAQKQFVEIVWLVICNGQHYWPW